MSVIIAALQYWWWDEEINVEKPLTPPSPINISKPLVEFSCSNCFKFMKNETDFTKKAKISKNTFIFCDEDCYVEWLSSPGTMLLGKLN